MKIIVQIVTRVRHLCSIFFSLLVLSTVPAHLRGQELPPAGYTVYAVVLGNQNYVVGSSTLRSGLFVSRDAGTTWWHIGPENVKGYGMDGVDTSNGRILYLAAGNGVHRSTDYGKSWKIVTDWRMTEVLDVKVDQSNPASIYAATPFGLWYSKDGGESWQKSVGVAGEVYCYRIREITPQQVIVEMRGVVTEGQQSGDEPASLDNLIPSSFLPVDRATMQRRDSTTDGLRTTTSQLPLPHLTVSTSLGDTIMSDVRSDNDLPEAWRSHPYEHVMHSFAAFIPGDGRGPTLFHGTFGSGIYRWMDGKWKGPMLDGSQVWSIVIKPYLVDVEVGHVH